MRGWDVAGLQFLLGRHGFPPAASTAASGRAPTPRCAASSAGPGWRADGLAGPGDARAAAPAPAGRARSSSPCRSPRRSATASARAAPASTPASTSPSRTARAIAAAGRGCVSFAGWSSGGYGKLVVIEHRLGMTSWYAHLVAHRACARARCVVAGTPIGRAGSTGRSTGPHLHFETRLRGAAVAPRF